MRAHIIWLVWALGACGSTSQPPLAPAPGVSPGPAATTAASAGGHYTASEASRGRAQVLQSAVNTILSVLLPRVEQVRTALGEAIAALPVPVRLATQERSLKEWGGPERKSYGAAVDVLYGEAEQRLTKYYDVALATATARALKLSSPRSPLDEGVTGETAQNLVLADFQEALRDVVGLGALRDDQERDRVRATEYLQVFSSFGHEGAEVALGGRLLLFVGGSPEGQPLSMLFYRGARAKSRSVRQVVRHRIMLGDAIEHDLGWRLDPGRREKGNAETEYYREYMLARDIAPHVNTSAASFDRLRARRIVVDIQTALFDDQAGVVGGVDWQVEFMVSNRGEVTWRLGPPPKFDPYCSNAKQLLAGRNPER